MRLFPSVSREDLIWDSDLGLPRAIAHHFSICDGATIFLASQVPPGSGLGLSGSVAVSMIKAIAFSCGLDLGPKEVAELACYIEIDKMGMPVGKQDQYASAFGGPNSITFDRHGVAVEPLRLLPETRRALSDGMMLFFLGASCQSSTILMRQRERILKQDSDTMRKLEAAKELAMATRVALESGDLDGFGELLHRSWMEKREIVPGISNPALDQCYQEALQPWCAGWQRHRRRGRWVHVPLLPAGTTAGSDRCIGRTGHTTVAMRAGRRGSAGHAVGAVVPPADAAYRTLGTVNGVSAYTFHC